MGNQQPDLISVLHRDRYGMAHPEQWCMDASRIVLCILVHQLLWILANNQKRGEKSWMKK